VVVNVVRLNALEEYMFLIQTGTSATHVQGQQDSSVILRAMKDTSQMELIYVVLMVCSLVARVQAYIVRCSKESTGPPIYFVTSQT
jgi:hypothetical protein